MCCSSSSIRRPSRWECAESPRIFWFRSMPESRRNKPLFFGSGRGGHVHGPGQVVCYPIVDLRSMGISVREYVCKLEETVIAALRECGVQGFRQQAKVGVWTAPKDKIASIGIRISRRITFHGFSVNGTFRRTPRNSSYRAVCLKTRMISVNELVDRKISRDWARQPLRALSPLNRRGPGIVLAGTDHPMKIS